MEGIDWDSLSFKDEDEFIQVSPEIEASQTVAGPPLAVASKLSWLKQRKQWCDCVFIVGEEPRDEREEEKEDEDEAGPQSLPQLALARSQSAASRGPIRFLAHRLVLAAASPVFEAMLFPHPLLPTPQGVKGAGTVERPLEVRIPDADPAVFEAFLDCIYKDDMVVSSNLLDSLIKLGRKYQIPKIQAFCAEYMEKDVSLKNALELYQMAPALLGDYEFGADFIRSNVEELLDESTGDVYCLSGPRLRDLLAISDLESDEMFLFDAVMRWGKRQVEVNPSKPLREVLADHDILKRLHFPTMALKELSGIVFPAGVLTDEEVVAIWRYASSVPEKQKTLKPGFPTVKRKGCVKWNESLLLEKPDRKTLAKMFGHASTVKLELLFRASRDGFGSVDFHRIADNKYPTLIVMRPTTNTNIFGGYFGGSWAGAGAYSSAKAWLFSLKNQQGKPVKIIPSSESNNAYCSPTYGPTWGSGHDLHISTQMNSNSNYSSPSSYAAEPHWGVSFTRELLAGSYNFTLAEMEVFHVVAK